jgi:hypothetical protein
MAAITRAAMPNSLAPKICGPPLLFLRMIHQTGYAETSSPWGICDSLPIENL